MLKECTGKCSFSEPCNLEHLPYVIREQGWGKKKKQQQTSVLFRSGRKTINKKHDKHINDRVFQKYPHGQKEKAKKDVSEDLG